MQPVEHHHHSHQTGPAIPMPPAKPKTFLEKVVYFSTSIIVMMLMLCLAALLIGGLAAIVHWSYLHTCIVLNVK